VLNTNEHILLILRLVSARSAAFSVKGAEWLCSRMGVIVSNIRAHMCGVRVLELHEERPVRRQVEHLNLSGLFLVGEEVVR